MIEWLTMVLENEKRWGIQSVLSIATPESYRTSRPKLCGNINPHYRVNWQFDFKKSNDSYKSLNYATVYEGVAAVSSTTLVHSGMALSLPSTLQPVG
jgi:hypothetical protein